MIIKVQEYIKGETLEKKERIYSDIKVIIRDMDINGRYLLLKKSEDDEGIVIYIDKSNEKECKKLVDTIWLMNDEGKTIEKLV